jgi:poly-gamma-glutamate capsule biosynthesis protein CapA/YwtB (metallophosphatase superfamily)
VVSRRVRRRRRQFALVGGLLFLLLIYAVFISGGGKKPSHPASTHSKTAAKTFPKRSPLNPNWRGDGKAVTMAFGGDVHFAGAVGVRLTEDPSTALGDTVSQLFSGAQLRMVNLETALTNGSCPTPADKQYIFDAPSTAVTALKSASITVATQANDHALDCGQAGLAQAMAIAKSDSFPLIGIGNTAAQAFAPYRVTINGQRIAVIAATQVIASNLVSTWTATTTQPGVASALNPQDLIRAVQQARRTSDTVIVYLHWGTETVACPNPQQEPLAEQLVKAGADIIIGSNAHVLLGGGYLGQAYVDYGLGNFAFYDNTAPETDSGALILTAVGRHITSATFKPATIIDGLPEPLTGTPESTAEQNWVAARSCTNLLAAPTTSTATEAGETVPFVTPTTTTTAPTTAATTTTPGSAATTTTSKVTTTTKPHPTTTQPTDNAG